MIATITTTRRGPGRPDTRLNPTERKKHLAALVAHRLGVSAPAIAMRCGVSVRVVYLWIKWASDYPEATDDARLADLVHANA